MYVYIYTYALPTMHFALFCLLIFVLYYTFRSLNPLIIQLNIFSLMKFDTVKSDVGSTSGVVFQGHQGVKLQNYVIKTLFPGSSVIACLKVCADIQECFSVNYFVLNGLCELNSYNYMMSDPIDAAGYIWYPY